MNSTMVAAAVLQYGLPLLIVGGLIHRKIKGQTFFSRLWKMAIGFWVTAVAVTGTNQDGPVRDLLLPLYDGSNIAIRAKVALVIIIPFLLIYSFSTLRKAPEETTTK